MSENPSEPAASRRRILKWASGCATFVVAAVAGLDYFFPRLRRWVGLGGGYPFQPVAAVDSLPTGKWKLVSFDVDENDGGKKVRRKHSAWVRRGDGPNAIDVLSPVCPHAGCQVIWRPEKSSFVCPCHGGTFDADGRLKSGPPRQSLDTLDFRVEAGQLLVSWHDAGS